jgi:methanogenic corrinoid protein MtbC1
LNLNRRGLIAQATRLYGQLHQTYSSLFSRSGTPGKGLPSKMDADWKESLTSLIETQIISRLIEAHPTQSAPQDQQTLTATAFPDFTVDAETLMTFVELCLKQKPDDALAHVKKLREEEVSIELIFLKLITPAARLLGEMWDEDKTDFAQVTLGLLCLHQITHELGYEYQDGPQRSGPLKRVMIASAPGSQHFLGLSIVSEFFRKEGWDVVVEISTTETELCHSVSNEWFDLIGLSVGLREQLVNIPALVSNIRKASKNPVAAVILGGPAFLSVAATAQSLGADAISTDPCEAIKLASDLVDSRKTQTVSLIETA